eukprot:Awhi_evm2s14781
MTIRNLNDIFCATLTESRLIKQVQVLNSSFRGPRRSSEKVIKSIIAENDLEKSFYDFNNKEITLMQLSNLVKTKLSVAHYENLWDKLNKKSKCNFYQKIQLNDMANAKSMKKE